MQIYFKVLGIYGNSVRRRSSRGIDTGQYHCVPWLGGIGWISSVRAWVIVIRSCTTKMPWGGLLEPFSDEKRLCVLVIFLILLEDPGL